MEFLFLLGCLVLHVSALNQWDLVNKLETTYNADVRPVANSGDVLNVSMEISVHQILSLDQKKQVLTVDLWLRQYWYDEHMTWDPTEYDNTSQIVLPPNQLWKPDMTILNEADRDGVNPLLLYNMKVLHTGYVTWLAPMTASVSCQLDMTYFPWDEQACFIEYISWIHDGSEIDVFNLTDQIDISNLVPHVEWDVISGKVDKIVAYYGCCPEPFPSLRFTMQLKRKPLFYILNLILPCMLVTTMGLLAFCIPADAGEKIAVSITMLLTTMVFLIVAGDYMPVQSIVIPYIGQYLFMSFALQAVAAIGAATVLYVHHRGAFGKPVPAWIRRLMASCHVKCGRGNSREGTKQNNSVQPKEHKCVSNVNPQNSNIMSRNDDCSTRQDDLKYEWMTLAALLDKVFLVLYIFIAFGINVVFFNL